jgi:hypothetical protein
VRGDEAPLEDRVAALERRVADLEDQLLTLVTTVRFDPGRPYTTLVLGLGFVGE